MTLTQKQETFTLAVFEGKTQAEAYRLAYSTENMSDATVWQEASRLMANPKVSARLAELRAIAQERTSITVQRVLTEYGRIAFADMRRFAAVGPDGVTLRDSDEWTDDDAAAVAEVSESTSKDGGSIKFKLHNKVSALDALAKHLGMFVERSEVDVTMRVEALSAVAQMTPEQLKALAEGARASS